MSSMSARFLQPRFATPTAAVKESCDGPEVVREACRGNRAAFGQLYSRYAPMVHGVLLARVPYAEAEDLVHEVFVAAFRQIGKLRSPEAFPGWLAAIARNSAVEFHRTERHRSEADLEAAKRPTSEPENNAIHVLEIIRKLPDAYRETLVLRLVEGMTGPEIAERTGLTPDSVRVNLFRGMKMLREQIEGNKKS